MRQKWSLVILALLLAKAPAERDSVFSHTFSAKYIVEATKNCPNVQYNASCEHAKYKNKRRNGKYAIFNPVNKKGNSEAPRHHQLLSIPLAKMGVPSIVGKSGVRWEVSAAVKGKFTVDDCDPRQDVDDRKKECDLVV